MPRLYTHKKRSSRYRRRRRRHRGKAGKSRTLMPRTLATRVKALEKATEWKWVDASKTIGTLLLPLTDTWIGTNLIPDLDQGVSGGGLPNDNARDGNQVNMRTLQCRGYAARGDTTNVIRVIVVKVFDNLDFITTGGPNQFLESAVSGGALFPLVSPYKKSSTIKFKIVIDKLLYINSSTRSTGVFNFKIPLPAAGEVLDYDTASLAGVQPVKTNYLMYCSCDSTAVPNPAIYMNTRMTFTDS